MNRILRLLGLLLVSATIFASPLGAEQPETVVVAAANSGAPTPAPSQSAAAQTNSISLQEAIQTLEAMKATNSEVLAKQQATLERLDDLQLAANQIKIFAHRTGG